MGDWGWVTFGYLAVYTTLAAYAGWTVLRIRRAAGRLADLE